MRGSRREMLFIRIVVLCIGFSLMNPSGAIVGAQSVELSVWSYLPPDDPSVAAYIETFQQQNPNITVNYTAFPEDDYQEKVRTALTAESPPDIALIEDRAWMKAGLVVELTEHFPQWGVDPVNFNPGGMARAAPEGNIDAGIFAVGDFLGGNVLFYNKALFDEAGIAYPSADQSIAWSQYAEICRAVGKPDRNPANAVYGCSADSAHFGIWQKWLFGEDGRTALGNMNSDAMVEAWNLGTALARDGYVPSDSMLQTVPFGVSDLFAQGKIAMTWSDFTEVSKYQASGINFGIAPFYVITGSESFVDTWTAPWGTFRDSPHPEEALKFLQFIATDAQYIRAETSPDPPLSTQVAQEIGWGSDDPIKQEYLAVLQQAKPQVFVPPLSEGAFDAGEIYRRMTVEGETDAKPLLDEAATSTQPLLDQAWVEWENLAPAQ